MDRWKDRVVVVTGASSGIGQAVARTLAEHGMKVAALARRLDRLQKLQDICKTFKGSLKPYKCDITNENEITSTLKSIVKDLGPISVLVNNAALFCNIRLTDTNQGTSRKLFETNVIGLVTITQHVVEIMQKHNITDGHVININSLAGHSILPVTGAANYCASKHALTVLTESLKDELAAMKSKIRVTSLSPGLVESDMADIFTNNSVHCYPNLIPDDIVECLIFVLSVKPNINKLEEDCKNLLGKLKAFKCDCSNENEITSTMQNVLTDFGPISILINNAAILAPMKLTDTSEGSCRKLYETNVIGLVTITQHAVEIMQKYNITDGHIININSINGHCRFHRPGLANYCASKNAVRVLTESLKNELALLKTKIRVTSISPGLVMTEMIDPFSNIKQRLHLLPEDIVEGIVFVLSAKANINVSELTIEPTGGIRGAFMKE